MLIHIAAHPLTLLWLAFGPSPEPPLPTLPPGLAEKTAQAPAAVAKIGDDIARWNDRTTPRKTLETFYFAITGYDRSPGLIANAIDCLDLDGLDPEMRERDAALLAHQLEFILNRQAIPLYGIPERPEGDRVVLDEVDGLPIALARQPDGRWRFDAETVGRIGKLRRLVLARPARSPGGACQDGGRADRPVDDLAHVRGGRDGPARLRPGRGVPRPPRRPAQAPRLEGGGDGAEARLRDAAVRVPVLAGGPQRPRRLPLRLALQPPRPDHARAGPAPRGPGRLALQPGDPAQPRRAGRGVPPQDPRPPVRR